VDLTIVGCAKFGQDAEQIGAPDVNLDFRYVMYRRSEEVHWMHVLPQGENCIFDLI